MTFSLPPRFVEDTNELVTLFRDYEASAVSSEKSGFLRKALVTACRLLSSIDLHGLADQIDKIYADVKVYERTEIKTTTWSEAMFGNGSHFEYFLKNVEDGLLKAVGLKKENRKRILKELRALQQLARRDAGTLTSRAVVYAIRELTADVCLLKDQEVTAAQQLNRRNKIVKAILVSVIVCDAVGSVVFPTASPAALAASVTLGGVAQFLPDPA